MRITTKARILGYLKYRDFTSGTELEAQAEAWGTKSSVISRRARELHQEGKLERSMSFRKTVQYRHKQARVPIYSPYQEMVRQDQEKNGVLL